MDIYMHEELRHQMAKKARNTALGALACSVILFSIPYIAIGLGALSILFAILSKGYHPKLEKDAKSGIRMGIIALCISLGILGSSIYKLKTDVAFRNDILDTIDSFYGEEYENLYGESFSDMFNELIGGGTNVDL